MRELLHEAAGLQDPPGWRDGRLHFVYRGADRLRRTMTVQFSPEPHTTEEIAATFRIKVPARDAVAISVTIVLRECAEETDAARATCHIRQRPLIG
ncbi:hypothetical protein AOX55_00005937 (plasmid) [Sinorhizobium fredii CCBAU 25509]|nr:hypothetical protein AOX55_00005937 [Sinorhizobium fredii CCBAU 25509]